MLESITLETIVFLMLAVVSVALAVMVLMSREIMHSALFLAAFFITIAVTYVLLGTPFLAAVQVLIYVGGVAVMIIFVIFLVKPKKEHEL